MEAVFFGATVDVEDEDGKKKTYQIVGPDEANPTEGRVSFQSPLGRALLKKKVGDPIQIETRELKVVGIVKGGALVEDGSVILSLPLLQDILGSQGRINAIDIRVTPGTTEQEMRELSEQIHQLVPEVRAVTVSEHLSNSEGFRLARAMSWGTSLLAVTVGVLGVMNTMLMTVFERTHEICVLLAVGWTRGRIMRMVLYESALLGLVGGAP